MMWLLAHSYQGTSPIHSLLTYSDIELADVFHKIKIWQGCSRQTHKNLLSRLCKLCWLPAWAMLQNCLCMLAQTKLLSVITSSAYFEITANRFASKVRASTNWYLFSRWVDVKIHFGQIRLLNSYPQQHNIVLLTLRKPVILKFGWWDGRRIMVACCGLNLSTSTLPQQDIPHHHSQLIMPYDRLTLYLWACVTVVYVSELTSRSSWDKSRLGS